MVLSSAVRVSMIGMAVGCTLLLILARRVPSAVGNVVDLHDPVSYFSAGLIVMITVLLAALGPASKAAGSNPAEILRG